MKSYAKFEDEKITIKYDHGKIHLHSQGMFQILNHETIETFYDMVEFWLIQKSSH